MPSAVDICNTALAHIGAEQLVTSIDPPDGSVEAGLCKTFYPIARRAALEAENWSFARTRVALAQVANPSTAWLYAYQLPSNCLTARRILPLQLIDAASLNWPPGFDEWTTNWRVIDDLFSERGSSAFEIEGNVLLTNEPDAVLLYTQDVTDTSKFSALFSSSLGLLIASYLAGPLIKGSEGRAVGQALANRAEAEMSRAAASDANDSKESAEYVPQSILVRA